MRFPFRPRFVGTLCTQNTLHPDQCDTIAKKTQCCDTVDVLTVSECVVPNWTLTLSICLYRRRSASICVVKFVTRSIKISIIRAAVFLRGAYCDFLFARDVEHTYAFESQHELALAGENKNSLSCGPLCCLGDGVINLACDWPHVKLAPAGVYLISQ